MSPTHAFYFQALLNKEVEQCEPVCDVCFVFPAQHLQRTPAAGGTGPEGVWANASLQACQQKLRLQSLQMERERLKQRQQEIRIQVIHNTTSICAMERMLH